MKSKVILSVRLPREPGIRERNLVLRQLSQGRYVVQLQSVDNPSEFWASSYVSTFASACRIFELKIQNEINRFRHFVQQSRG